MEREREGEPERERQREKERQRIVGGGHLAHGRLDPLGLFDLELLHRLGCTYPRSRVFISQNELIEWC